MKGLKLLFLFWSILIWNQGVAQTEIRGKVVDAETLEPIEDATVFLNNSSIGTVTGKDGGFELKLLPGVHDLVVRRLDYELFSITLDNDVLNSFYEIRLVSSAVEVDGLNVEAERDPLWYEGLEIFKDYFIGRSSNSKNTEIQNPKDLIIDFQKEKGWLRVVARNEINIENKNLGYLITYSLIEFTIDFEKDEVIYLGYAQFEDLDGSRWRRRRYNRNREKAYNGSMIHLMRVLYADELENSGFELHPVAVPNQIDESLMPTPPDYQHVVTNVETSRNSQGGEIKIGISKIPIDESNHKEKKPLEVRDMVDRVRGRVLFSLDTPVRVIYKHESPENAFLRELDSKAVKFRRHLKQESLLELKGRAVRIFEDGGFYHPMDIFVKGYMAWEKIADLVPLDYMLDEEIEK